MRLDISRSVIVVFLIGLLLAWDGTEKIWEGAKDRIDKSSNVAKHTLTSVVSWGVPMILYGICFIFMASETHKPFLYFRF